MASRNQNRPPKSPKKDDAATDKRRKIGFGRPGGATSTVRGRPILSSVNPNQESAGDPTGAEISEPIEFTKDEVETMLNEKIKAKKYDTKGTLLQLSEMNKRLKLCIKWFQGKEQGLNEELEKLRLEVNAAENKSEELDMLRKNKEDELNAVIGNLKECKASLEDSLKKEVSDKLDAIKSCQKETEAKETAEKLKSSLSEEIERIREEKKVSDSKAESFEDMYKRVQEYNTSLQLYNSKMQNDLATVNQSLHQVEKEKSAALESLTSLRGQVNQLNQQLTLFKASHADGLNQKEILENELKSARGELQMVREERDRHFSQVQILNTEIEKYKETTGKSISEIEKLMVKSNALEETCSSQRQQLNVLNCQLAAANEKLKMADLSVSETLVQFERKQILISELKDRLADAELQIIEGEKLRKKLHNTILELKGNIRVFCRVRPLLPEDCFGSEAPVVSYPNSGETRDRGVDLVQNGQKYPFTFDKVFNPEASQNDVFVEISQLVQSALDGYKVCIFAYGQTGSGKTYTMMGRPDSFEQKGLIPRSLEQIFQTSQSLSAQGWKYKMQASMLEIYNETIRDLLSTNRSSSETIRVENSVPGKQYSIKHDANGNTYVSDLTIVDVCSIKEVSSLLSQAAQSRSVGKTQMNEQSSRSHFVFTLRISGVNENTEQQVQGVLNLIDLAGSERLSKSGATGERLKETQAINKSLSCLADVIFALAKKEDHVPFRNSKLTYLLQPCLGGDSKTLMFVNLSPEPSSVSESLCSLRFAARVNSCEIGIPRRQTQAGTRSSDSRLSSLGSQLNFLLSNNTMPKSAELFLPKKLQNTLATDAPVTMKAEKLEAVLRSKPTTMANIGMYSPPPPMPPALDIEAAIKQRAPAMNKFS
ncbi:hypothetical protein V2J09_019271 [Rumex salicifolius]